MSPVIYVMDCWVGSLLKNLKIFRNYCRNRNWKWKKMTWVSTFEIGGWLGSTWIFGSCNYCWFSLWPNQMESKRRTDYECEDYGRLWWQEIKVTKWLAKAVVHTEGYGYDDLGGLLSFLCVTQFFLLAPDSVWN